MIAISHWTLEYGAGITSKWQSGPATAPWSLQIVGNRHGYVPQQDMAGLIEEINASRADILFVALGSPRQEFWMSTYLPQLKVKVCQGVGGTFDVIAGTVRRAPKGWRDLHLEWAYRLIKEPRRLPRQVVLPKFAWRVLAERLGRHGT